jgi:membrane protein involved in colicin uptake
MRRKKEKKMKLRDKLAILLISIIISVALFNILVPSSAVELIKMG